MNVIGAAAPRTHGVDDRKTVLARNASTTWCRHHVNPVHVRHLLSICCRSDRQANYYHADRLRFWPTQHPLWHLKVIAPFTNIENKPHITMAKGEDRRKEEKKKPLKTLKEKRAEKQAKKANRS